MAVRHPPRQVALRDVVHAALWLALYAAWLTGTRRYHPTLPVAAGATAVLVGASALAVYAHVLVLWPRLARRGRWARYAAAGLATFVGIDLAAVALIQLVYAWLWHPDPRRFGLGFNLAADGAIIFAHVALLSAPLAARRRGPAR